MCPTLRQQRAKGWATRRAFNNVQGFLQTKGSQIIRAVPLDGQAALGNTVDSCASHLTPSSSLVAEAHPDNGKYATTPSNLNFFHLNEGRLGPKAQKINMTLNWCTHTSFSAVLAMFVCDAPPGPVNPYIYSYPLFDAHGNYTITNQIFPSYYIYENGVLVNKIVQHPVEDFIKLDGSAQIRASDIK